MSIFNRFSLLLSLAVISGGLARAEGEAERLVCSQRLLAPPAPSGSAERKYAPDRQIQVQHLQLDITPDFKARTIAGKAVMRFKPVVRPARELRLDSVDLNIQSVSATESVHSWQVTDSQLIITFAEAVAPEKEVTLTIAYSAEPQQGLYFRTPEMGYKQGDTHLFTQGEAVQGRYWYPCMDTPNQMFTSEIICRVPKGMTAISNGRKISEAEDPNTGLTAVHWSQEKKHANYLISLLAGYFNKLEDNCHNIPLAFYTPPSEFQYASNSFRGTKEMVAFFEEETGMPYPWDKYDQVCVNDFVAGGMENTSVTTLTDGTLFSVDSENINDSEGLVAHELAHQWFGDLVTCKDWSHLWLNEGFATYYETLWSARRHGRDAMLYELYARARQITGIPNDTTPIVRRTYDHPDEMFGYLVYPKAGWVLHMLRAELGDDLYRLCIKTYLQRHQFSNVVTDDLRAVVEQLSGRSFDQFFDQWLYHGHHPELEVSYSWDESAGLARVSIRQTQEVNANVLLFNIPLTVRFKGKFGTADKDIRVSNKQEDFYFPLASAPEVVRVDPEYTLLASIKFSVPAPMLRAQLADQEDLIGRFLAIEQIQGRSDRESLARLKEVLNGDSFYGVRLEASKALRAIHTPEALEVLLASTRQPDARVRRQVVDDVGGFFDEKSRDFGRKVLEEEKNPEIRCTALRDLGGYSHPDNGDFLKALLGTDSFRNQVADAAVNAMRSQDDPRFIMPLMETLQSRQAAFTTHGFAQGLSTLAYLARNEDQKDKVREFLTANVTSSRKTVQIASINALGTLGDPKAIAALQKFVSAGKESSQRSAAERAVGTLRAARKPVDDFKNLRQEVLDLQKSNRELKKDLADLKKRVESQPAVLAAASTNTAAATPKTRVLSPKHK